MPSSQAPPPGSTALDPTAVRPPIDDARIERVGPSEVRSRLAALKAEGFSLLLDLGGVDYLEREPRFDVVYHLLKFPTTGSSQLVLAPERVRILCGVNDGEHVPTVSDLWESADWAEREVFDLFGIVFDGHPDLRRIQMPVEWAGYPLRKDYPVRGPALERTPRPSFANKSNVAAGTPPSGRVAVALQRQIALARAKADGDGVRPPPARGTAEPEAAKGGGSPSQHTAGEATPKELGERPINLKTKSNEK